MYFLSSVITKEIPQAGEVDFPKGFCTPDHKLISF